ncbi:MAG: hypothetical protein KDE05_04330 [Parvularculaceae bacterium]|nr:hypothetical protein [Parvularculaceae bacterium]
MMGRFAGKAAATGLAVFLLAAAAPFLRADAGAADAVVTINPVERFQTISGWEATAEMGGEYDLTKPPPWSAEVIDRAVDEVGINRIRLEATSGIESDANAWRRLVSREIDMNVWRPLRYETKNDNDDPHVINPDGFDFSELDWRTETVVLPLMRKLGERGERLYVNLCYVSFLNVGKNLHYDHDDPEEYAEFMLATFQHLKEKYDLVPDALEVILEPDLTPFWSVNGGKRIGAAIEATAQRLDAAGFHPEFIAPSVTNMSKAPGYIDGIMKNKTARERIAEFSYHRYRGATPIALASIAAKAKRYSKRTSMLEYWGGKGKPEILHADLKDGMNSAWQARALAGYFSIKKNPNGYVAKLNKDTHFNRLYFQAARAGWTRIGADTSNAEFDPVAFQSPMGEGSIVIQAARAGEVDVKGLPPGRYQIEVALDGLVLRTEAAETRDGNVRIVFPAKGYGSIRPARS